MLNELAQDIYKDNVEAGWWEGRNNHLVIPTLVGTKFALIHSETSEAFEGYRKDQVDSHLSHRPAVEVELADQIIRTLDLVAFLGLDIDGAIEEKRAYNKIRLDHKKQAREAAGGKKF